MVDEVLKKVMLMQSKASNTTLNTELKKNYIFLFTF